MSYNKEYWYTFDIVKGILIILVFLGHIIPGALRSTFPRYAIYSFHMPLFIGVSGFLFNIKVFDMNFREFLKKYWGRLGLPWIIAVIVYYLVNKGFDFHLSSIAASFYSPYYHLWYVLGIVSYIVIVRFLWRIFKNRKNKWLYIFIISALISIISKWGLFNFECDVAYIPEIIDIISFDFRLYNLIFFVIGVYLRYRLEHCQKICSDMTINISRVLMVLSIIVTTILYFYDYTNVENLLFYIMNISIVLVVVYDCLYKKLPRNKVLEFVGKYSLPIYLYHVLGKILAETICDKGSGWYYVICICSFVLLCLAVSLLRKVRVINRFVFGSTSTRLKK